MQAALNGLLCHADIQRLLERCAQRSQVAVFTSAGDGGATARSPEMSANPRAAHFFYTQVRLTLCCCWSARSHTPSCPIGHADGDSAHLTQGGSVYVSALERSFPELAWLRERWLQELGCPHALGQWEVFASRAGAHTSWHWDQFHVFTFQLAGRKRWAMKPSPHTPHPWCAPYRPPASS